LLIQNHYNAKLAAEIIRRADRDQVVRKLAMGTPPTSPQFKKYITLMSGVDHDNTARMKAIVNRYGWPGKSLLGEKAASDAWLMIQHADADRAFQRQCFPLVLKALDEGDIARPDAALFIDRVLVGEGKPQLYGSQFTFVDGTLKPSPIMDPETVDDRRKAMHLMPMKEYEALLADVYKAQLKPKK
jgi:hypothetical protein